MKQKIQLPTFSQLVRHLVFGWLVAALTEYLLLPGSLKALDQLQGIAAMSMPRLLLTTAGVALVMWVISQFFCIDRYERWAMLAVFSTIAAISLSVSYSFGFLLACLIVFAVFAVYAIFGSSRKQEAGVQQKPHWVFPVFTGLLALGFFAIVCIWTVNRVRTFSTPTFDFGLFAQMFHNMKETGLPMTTLERDGPLSHFAVHVSPIYYLMLPFYWLFPTPATLQVLQAAVLASSVIPMWLIGKQRKLHGLVRFLLCIILLLLPTTAGGTSYDLHENCFLLPLILWMLYGIEKKSPYLAGIFAFLTLMVKEDAAVYVAIAAIYWLFQILLDRQSRKSLFTAMGMLAMSLLWFFLVTDYLANQGDGVMTYRYKNFMYDGSDSLFTVIKAVLLCPFKMLFECADPEKSQYFALTFLPLLGLPLMTRKYERLLLLIPYLLLNLMSDYLYQHDIMFQYSFGSTAFLFYLAAVNLSDLKINWLRLIPALTAAAVCFCLFIGNIWPRFTYYFKLPYQYAGYYQGVRNALDQVPDDPQVSVAATTFFTTYLSQREAIYDIGYCSEEHLLSCEYVVLKCKEEDSFKKYEKYGQDGFDGIQNFLLENGYELYCTHGSVLVIYRKTP